MKATYLLLVPVMFLLTGFDSVPVPLSEQLHASDAVIIGRAVRNTSCISATRMKPCVVMDNVVFIHNKKNVRESGTISVIMDIGIREMIAKCCTDGESYLMFLSHHKGRFYIYHGKWSILTINGPSVTESNRRPVRR